MDWVANPDIRISLLEIVFSFDSGITAVGMARQIEVIVAAIVIATAAMLAAAGPVSGFVNDHPTIKISALSFLVLIGAALVAEGVGFHISNGYICFAMAFSWAVEGLDPVVRRRRRRTVTAHDGG